MIIALDSRTARQNQTHACTKNALDNFHNIPIKTENIAIVSLFLNDQLRILREYIARRGIK